MSPLPEKIPKYLANHTKYTVTLEITQNLAKSFFPAYKKGFFKISAQIEEIETPVNLNKDWEILGKTEESSVRGELKENSRFWKNELKPSLFVQNIIDNGYIIPFITIPPSIDAPNNKSSLRIPDSYLKLFQNYLKKQLRRTIRSKTLLLQSLGSSHKQKALTHFKSSSR